MSSAALQPVPPAFAQALRDLELAGDEELLGEPLTGGVSSDIWRIETARGPVCAKRALPKLRVAADWRAPIERNRYEARWMQVAQAAQPGCTPQLLGQHAELGVLVMRWLPPGEHVLWKSELMQGRSERVVAQAVGSTLAHIHAYAAARAAELAPRFDSQTIFFDIRLEPYLIATARRHPELAEALQRLVVQTQSHALTLVHGDVSPKNILIGPEGPVLLDAECACWSDPAFDLAFCLNHLLLKGVWAPQLWHEYVVCMVSLAEHYLAEVDWEPREGLEQRAAALLPGLLLARIDGKSPVEYITSDADRDAVRRVARHFLLHPPAMLVDIIPAWQQEFQP